MKLLLMSVVLVLGRVYNGVTVFKEVVTRAFDGRKELIKDVVRVVTHVKRTTFHQH